MSEFVIDNIEISSKDSKQKRPEKDIKILLKKKKKSVNIAVNLIKIFLRKKAKASWV